MRGVFLFSVLMCASAVQIDAQPVAGSGVVSGRILDRYGEGMPEAEVTVENPAMGIRRVLETSLDGIFEAAGLVPASGYRLKATHERYADWESAEFEVPAGERVNFVIRMVPREGGDETEKSAPPVAQISPVTEPLGILLGRQELDTLPVAQRRWETLAPLAPAVAVSRSLGAPAVQGNAFSTAYFTDGLFTVNGFLAARAVPAGRTAQDAVYGLQVLAAGAPVEFGHGMAGAVNVVTRSGGQSFHGSFYEYFTNRSLHAVDRHALGRNLFRKRHQGGFELGGPLPASNLFFFSNLEISDAHGQGLNRVTSRLIADESGTGVAASNCRASAAQCSSAARFLEGQMNGLVPRSEHWVTGLLKADYRRSDRHTVSVAGYGTRSRFPPGGGIGFVAPDGGLLGDPSGKQDTHYGKIEWISTPGPKAGNELRLGVFHDRISRSASRSGLPTGRISINVAGVTLGEPYPDPATVHERRMQLVDNFRASSGSHTFLIGIDWTRTRDRVDGLANGSGAYFYPSLTAFAQDLSGGGQRSYTQFTQTFGNPVRNLPSSEFGFYLQDGWRATPRLHVTAGIRWSKAVLPRPERQNSRYFQTGQLNSPNINADPRIAAAYSLNDRTVLRAGWGMFHAPHAGEMVDAFFLGNGIYQSSVLVTPLQAGAPVFPNLLSASSIPRGALNLLYAASKLRNPYAKQTIVSLERHVGGGVTVTAGYVGHRGVKLWTAEDNNLGAPGRIGTYAITDAGGRREGSFSTPLWTTRNDLDYAHIFQVNNGGSSWYRALVVQLRKRLGHGLSAQAAYTWSHAIDDLGGGRIAGSIPWNSYNTDHRADRGSSATDQRHRAVVEWLWQPRPAQGHTWAARYVLNGWEISSIATLASGQPSTALVVVAGQQQFPGIGMAFPGSLNGSGAWSRVPFLPVNHLYSDPEYTVNARLSRTLPFTERVTGRLVFEAFNAFNTPFDTGLRTVAYTASAGVLSPVPGVGTGNASHGYPAGSNARSCQVAFRLTF